MKNVRLYFKKTGDARFISHLDTVRFITRLIRRAGLPVWYTEGFNPHLYITFALPLSLGFESEYELADIRLNDDNFPLSDICEKLNQNSTPSFIFLRAEEPKSKLSDLCFADFSVWFEDRNLVLPLKKFLSSEEITVEKKTKKGDIKSVDIKPDIKRFSVSEEDGTALNITLPAGPNKNINPELLINKFLSDTGIDCYYKITRKALLDSTLSLLK